jgi:hypothetical protein
VNEIYLLMQEIQRTWSYLEPLFIGSEEVKRELPEVRCLSITTHAHRVPVILETSGVV